MKTIKLRVSDAIHAALVERAIEEGQGGLQSGPASVARKAIRYWLSKNGHHSADLDQSDEDYAHGPTILDDTRDGK